MNFSSANLRKATPDELRGLVTLYQDRSKVVSRRVKAEKEVAEYNELMKKRIQELLEPVAIKTGEPFQVTIKESGIVLSKTVIMPEAKSIKSRVKARETMQHMTTSQTLPRLLYYTVDEKRARELVVHTTQWARQSKAMRNSSIKVKHFQPNKNKKVTVEIETRTRYCF